METRSPGNRSLSEVLGAFRGSVERSEGAEWRIGEPALFEGPLWDDLAFFSVLGTEAEARTAVGDFIRGAASSSGAWLASIQPLYEAIGRGEASGLTVPAINVRGLTYDTARAIFRAAARNGVGAFIFEIARSEMDYTDQRPSEYSTLILAAAVREGHRGPVFVQGDHFQVKAARYRESPDEEIQALRDLVEEALAAGFYNIDIDSSTLVDLDREGVEEQQRLNFEVAAELTRFVRENEPEGVTVCLGGEIGEVGGRNSTPEELRAFMDGYLAGLGAGAGAPKGIGKISIQTGTTHGGVPLPDGRVAEVKLDFDTLENLSRIAREEYGLAGAVQHGASTLPPEAFRHFPERECVEVHLATGFQNIIYDSEHFPADIKAEMEALVEDRFAGEQKAGQTREQFLYKTRKKAFGPLKEKLWRMPQEVRDAIASELEAQFGFLYDQLRVGGTDSLVASFVKANPASRAPGQIPEPFRNP